MPRLKDLAGPAGEAADMAIEAAKIAKREAAKIPRPDPRDDPVFQMRASMEQIASRGSMPRRNRWKPLVELDRKVADLQARRAELGGQLAEIDARLTSVADSDQRQLALWIGEGEHGDPPTPSAPQLKEERDRLALVAAATDVAVSDTLEQRVQHVERHRGRMVRQAHAEVETDRADYLRLVGELRTVRAALVEARSVEIWASLFPNELAGSAAGNETNLCLGLMRPVKVSLGVTHQLGIEQMFSALEVDAHTIAEKLTPEQRKELGTSAAQTPEGSAMWHADPAYQEWTRQKQRELNELGGAVANRPRPGRLNLRVGESSLSFPWKEAALSEVARGEGTSRSSWMAPTALALSLLGLLGAIAFWLVVPILLAISGTILGYWARRSDVGGRAAQWAVVLGLLAIALNIGVIIASAAGAF